jgi:hypothetical protein
MTNEPKNQVLNWLKSECADIEQALDVMQDGAVLDSLLAPYENPKELAELVHDDLKRAEKYALSVAKSLGAEFAEEVYHDPKEKQNWSHITEVPELDYRLLRACCKGFEPSKLILAAYCDSFNQTFDSYEES